MMRAFENFGRDRRGAIAVMMALSFTVFVGVLALSVDVAALYFKKRQLQSVTDIAAIASAQNLSVASAAANSAVQLNGYAQSTVTSVVPGVYTPDPSLPPAQRFQPGAGGANAASVTTLTQAPIFFGAALFRLMGSNGPASFAVGARALATVPSEASFAIGATLVTVNGGIENAILGGLLGGNVSLSAMSYQSLLSENIDLFSFSNALAIRANMTGVTYNSLANGSFGAGQVFGAMLDAERANPNSNATAVDALAQIASLEAGSSSVMQLNPLINFGPFGGSPVGSQGLIGASVTAFDLLAATAEVANGQHQVQAALAVNEPGIVSANLALSIGERPVGTSWVSIGSVGASVHTAQTRLLLTVQLTGTAPANVVTLPLYLEIASGTATLSAIQCPTSSQASSVTLGVTPGVASAWVGAVSTALMSNFSDNPVVGPATLVNLAGAATITGTASAAIANMTPTAVGFSAADIASGTKHSTSTNDYLSSLVSSLIGNLSVNVNGFTLVSPGLLQGVATSAVVASAASIDDILGNVLRTLGISVGGADTWVTGVKCGQPVIVN